MPTVILKNVVKKLRGIPVLDDISLELHGGSIYGIVGGNGSGKTMLLRALSGLIVPTSGTVTVDGAVLRRDADFPPDAGILIENPEFPGHLSGRKNLLLLAEIRTVASEERIAELMRLFSLDPDSRKPVRKYSLGMKQKLGIIQAIMEDQKLLILDEPFNALDEGAAAILRTLLLRFREEGRLIVLTSHNGEDIACLCDRVIHISAGKIVGTTENCPSCVPPRDGIESKGGPPREAARRRSTCTPSES